MLLGLGLERLVPTFVSRKATSDGLLIDFRESSTTVAARTRGPGFGRVWHIIGATTKWTGTTVIGLTAYRDGVRRGGHVSAITTNVIIRSVVGVVRSVKNY